MNTHCEELPELKYRDGVHTIFLSTKGNNTTEVPEEIIKFLRYVSAGLKESEQNFKDLGVQNCQCVKNLVLIKI